MSQRSGLSYATVLNVTFKFAPCLTRCSAICAICRCYPEKLERLQYVCSNTSGRLSLVLFLIQTMWPLLFVLPQTFFWIEHRPMWRNHSIRYGHVATCIFRSASTTWAPSGHERASAPSLSPASPLLRKVADLLWVGYSWSELSKLATFLVCLKGKMGHRLRQQPRPKRDAMMFIIHCCYHAITCRKYFLIFLIIIWNNLTVNGTNYFT